MAFSNIGFGYLSGTIFLLSIGISVLEGLEDNFKIVDARSYIVKAKLMNYSSNVPPVPDDVGFVAVFTNFFLLSLLEVDEQTQTMTTNGYYELKWIDKRLAWDDDVYNVNHVHYKQKEIWHPDVTVVNTVTKTATVEDNELKLSVLSNGTVLWNPGDIFKTSCHLDITYFPFDAQICRIVTSTWMSWMDVQLRKHPCDIYSQGFGQNSIWNIESITKEIREEVSYVEIVLVLKRCPGYYLLSLLLPVLVLAGLVSLVFVMPLGHSDRASFSITILLSFVVFMTFLNDTLPKTSMQLSVIAVYVMSLFMISALSVGLAIYTLKIASYPQSKPIPNFLMRLISCRRKRRENKISPEMRASKALSGEGNADVCQDSPVTWKDVGRAVDSAMMTTMLLIIVGVSVATFFIIAINAKNGIYFNCK